MPKQSPKPLFPTLRNKQFMTVAIALLVIFYLLIGFLIYNQDLLFPQTLDPGYLAWAKTTPISERIFNVLFWPVWLIGNSFP